MPPPFRKQKLYVQKYRVKWELRDEFKGWLKPLPKSVSKAYCSACNVVIKAHLCDLRKHGAAKRHKNAMKLVRHLKKLNGEEVPDYNPEPKSLDNDTNDPSDDDDIVGLSEDEPDNIVYRWPSEAVESLLKHMKTYWKEYQSGVRRKKDILDDVAAAMSDEGYNISGFECGRKFRNIRMRYLSVLEKTLVGEAPNYRIDYFEDIHELLSKDPETMAYLEQKKLEHKPQTVIGECSDEDTVLLEDSGYDIITDGEMEWTEPATNLMLDLLLEFKDFFSGKEDENDDTVWQTIAEQMRFQGHEVEEEHCRRKWQNLVEQYTHYKSLVEMTGTVALWPHFMRVRHVLNTVPVPQQNLAPKKPLRLRLKRGRGRGKKRTLSERSGDSEREDGGFQGAADGAESSQLSTETYQRMRRLTDSAMLWQRLNSVETRLDDLCDQQDVQRHTNSLLSQILGQLATLANHLSPLSPSSHLSPNSVEVRDGITIVVPSSDQ